MNGFFLEAQQRGCVLFLRTNNWVIRAVSIMDPSSSNFVTWYCTYYGLRGIPHKSGERHNLSDRPLVLLQYLTCTSTRVLEYSYSPRSKYSSTPSFSFTGTDDSESCARPALLRVHCAQVLLHFEYVLLTYSYVLYTTILLYEYSCIIKIVQVSTVQVLVSLSRSIMAWLDSKDNQQDLLNIHMLYHMYVLCMMCRVPTID
jgi:hypothetical protein